MTLIALLDGAKIDVDIDIDYTTRIATTLLDGSVLYTTGTAPTTHKQLSALMQLLADNIWKHHQRQAEAAKKVE